MDTLNSEGMSFKRPAPQIDQNKRRSRSDPITLDIVRAYEEPFSTIPRRIRLYEENLNILSTHLQNVEKKFNAELDRHLEKFVDVAIHLVNKGDCVIPIGILESGLSDRENRGMFDFIQTSLLSLKVESDQKMYVARIQPGTISSTKAAFQKICGQIIGQRTREDTHTKIRKWSHFSLCDVRLFFESEGVNGKIFILVESVEYFPQSVISQLLMLMGCADFRVIFIFGTTHCHFIDSLIPFNCSAEFVVENFYSVFPADRVEDFMKRILFDCSNPFRISGPIAAYLQSHYMENNYSVEHISNCIKFCLRSHFFSASSAFCSLDNSNQYTPEETEIFKEYAAKEFDDNNASPPKRRKTNSNVLEADDPLGSAVISVQSWLFILLLFRFINSRLRDHPLGESFTSVYVSLYNGYTLSKENDAFHKLFRALGSISKSNLQDLILAIVNLLKDNSRHTEIELALEVSSDMQKLAQELADEETGNPELVPVKSVRLKKKHQSVKELQAELLEMKHQNDGTSAIHAIRSKFTEYMKKLVSKFSLCTKQLSKVYMFDDLNQLINAMFPANFLRLKEDLSDPGYNLQCSCCSTVSSGTIRETLPDTSIIHKIISEHTTRKVDLNLVYKAFVAIIQDLRAQKSKSKVHLSEGATNSYLVRFRKSVGELQHMGFIKRSKSKPDEISRLTWW